MGTVSVKMVSVRIKKIHYDAVIPSYAHTGDAAFDLKSVGDYLIGPGERTVVKTGLQIEIPEGYWGNIRDRSGMAAKYGIHILAGVIDSNYRGEVGVVMANLGKENYSVNRGDKIAQMIIQSYEHCEIKEVSELSETVRGEEGFGSTGK